MRALWRNPWSRVMLAIFVCGLVAVPPLLTASFTITMGQYSGQGWNHSEEFAWVMLINTLLTPFVEMVTLGSGLGLLATASIRRIRAQSVQS